MAQHGSGEWRVRGRKDAVLDRGVEKTHFMCGAEKSAGVLALDVALLNCAVHSADSEERGRMIGSLGVLLLALILCALGWWVDYESRKSMKPEDERRKTKKRRRRAAK